jgi:hypothetical protein
LAGRHLFTSESVTEGHPDTFYSTNLNFQGGLYALTTLTGTKERITPGRKEELLSILRADFGKVSQRETARRLDLGKTTVNRWNALMGLRHQKFTCNESFFDVWTEESAYVLGYVYTDGNIQCDPIASRWGLTITANERDVDHLEGIRQLLQITKPLLYAPKTRSYRMMIASRVLAEKLVRIGVVPRKSLIVEFPQVPRTYLRHFIRGVVDGDGSVSYIDRPRSPYFAIRIYSGSQRFLFGAEAAIVAQTGISARVYLVHPGNAYVLDYTCSRAERLGTWLYEDSHIFLDRKYTAFATMKVKRSARIAA